MQISRVNNTLVQEREKIVKVEKHTLGELQTHQNNFQQVLSNTIDSNNEIQFSKHASMRLKSRDIQFSGEQIERIENGILEAKAKGIRDSLVLVDNIALVVNTRNNIVITAMEQTQEGGNIYTNIDGAVIV